MYITYNQLIVKERNKLLRFGEVYHTEQGVYYVLVGGKIKLYPIGGESYDGDPTIIIQDSTHRFVTDAQITTWNTGVTPTLGLIEVGYGDATTGLLTSDAGFTYDANILNIAGTALGEGILDLGQKTSSQYSRIEQYSHDLYFSASTTSGNIYFRPRWTVAMYISGATGNVQIGTGTPFSNVNLNVVGTVVGEIAQSITNLSSTGFARIKVGEGTTNWGQLINHGVSLSAAYAGTSITAGNTTALIASNDIDGNYVTRSLMLLGGNVITLAGQTASNYGTRLDSTGLRIGQLSTLHTSNTQVFQVLDSYFENLGTTRTDQLVFPSFGGIRGAGNLYIDAAANTFLTSSSGFDITTGTRTLFTSNVQIDGMFNIRDGSETLNYIWTCVDAATGEGTWGPPPSGATLADGDYGDITVSGSGTVMTIDEIDGGGA